MPAKTQRQQTNRTDQHVPKVLREASGTVVLPELDMDRMSPNEKEMFLAVLTGSLIAMNDQQPIQNIRNMKAFFSSTVQSSIYMAGLHVQVYRDLKNQVTDGD
jgi:hypothetical protein